MIIASPTGGAPRREFDSFSIKGGGKPFDDVLLVAVKDTLARADHVLAKNVKWRPDHCYEYNKDVWANDQLTNRLSGNCENLPTVPEAHQADMLLREGRSLKGISVLMSHIPLASLVGSVLRSVDTLWKRGKISPNDDDDVASLSVFTLDENGEEVRDASKALVQHEFSFSNGNQTQTVNAWMHIGLSFTSGGTEHQFVIAYTGTQTPGFMVKPSSEISTLRQVPQMFGRPLVDFTKNNPIQIANDRELPISSLWWDTALYSTVAERENEGPGFWWLPSNDVKVWFGFGTVYVLERSSNSYTLIASFSSAESFVYGLALRSALRDIAVGDCLGGCTDGGNPLALGLLGAMVLARRYVEDETINETRGVWGNHLTFRLVGRRFFINLYDENGEASSVAAIPLRAKGRTSKYTLLAPGAVKWRVKAGLKLSADVNDSNAFAKVLLMANEYMSPLDWSAELVAYEASPGEWIAAEVEDIALAAQVRKGRVKGAVSFAVT